MATARKRKTPARRPATPLTVTAAVKRDLKALEKLDKRLATSTEAATALALAAELDGANSATSKSMCAARLNETMERLRAMAPPEEKTDAVDELAKKRQTRRSAATG